MNEPEATTVAEMAAELNARPEPMTVVLRPETALQLAGLLQLALRHQALPPSPRVVATAFLAAVREYFDGCPTILDILDWGDDPNQDMPA